MAPQVELNLFIVKSKFFVLALTAICFLTSFLPSAKDSINEGNYFPSFTVLENQLAENNLSLNTDELILLNFWSLDDAASRIRSNSLKKMVEDFDNIVFVNICTSSDLTLQDEILKIDFGMESNEKILNLAAMDVPADLLKPFEIESGNRLFILKSDGKVLSVMPSDSEIKSYCKIA